MTNSLVLACVDLETTARTYFDEKRGPDVLTEVAHDKLAGTDLDDHEAASR